MFTGHITNNKNNKNNKKDNRISNNAKSRNNETHMNEQPPAAVLPLQHCSRRVGSPSRCKRVRGGNSGDRVVSVPQCVGEDQAALAVGTCEHGMTTSSLPKF